MQKTLRKVLRAVANFDPDYYDMYADANEACFARLYVERIVRYTQQAGIQPQATLLEAGCQAGRLVIPFARLGFCVTGIDTSAFALRRAKRHASAAGVEAEFIRGDLLDVLGQSRQQYDVVVCAEVLYLSPRYRQMLEALAKAVRPGGLLCVSHRSKFYYLLEAMKQYDLETAATVLQRHEGPFRDSRYYNWQTQEDLRALYRAVGFRILALEPIDRFAWLGGMNPSQLTNDQRDTWVKLELESSHEAAMCARYVLVIAAHPE